MNDEKLIDEIHKCSSICVEHYNENELKCPYCLEEQSDSYEILMDGDNESGTTTCDECHRDYAYGTDISYRDGGVSTIHYTTFQLTQDTNTPKEEL